MTTPQMIRVAACAALPFLSLGAPTTPASADGLPASLRLGRGFSDHAVLQGGQPCPVFGSDLPGTRITVVFAGQTLQTVADTRGQWRVSLAPLARNGAPQSLVVRGSSTLTLTDLLVGDVWLISGQSNADWPLRSASGGSAAIASATNTWIRYLHLAEAPRTDAVTWSPAEVGRLNSGDYFSGAWQVNTPSSAGSVSAIGYFFIRHLATNQNLPLGLIDCTVGGTPAISWIPPEAIQAHPRLRLISEHYLESDLVPRFVRNRLLQNLADWDKAGRPAPMPEHPYKPGACWRNGLGPLAPFALRGVLWYQGETDADVTDPVDFDRLARSYTDTFQTLVSGWRAAWEQPTLPFYCVSSGNPSTPTPLPFSPMWSCATSASMMYLTSPMLNGSAWILTTAKSSPPSAPCARRHASSFGVRWPPCSPARPTTASRP